jgi:LPXTG-site transpeptidase (sortase) family protein
LFQFISVRFVLGFYETALPLDPPPVVTVLQKSVKSMDVQTVKGLPMRLKIPRINVNAAINHVGLSPEGSMGVPKRPNDTAWYMLGPKPGDAGSAVIAGHVNWWYGATGVFKNLKLLKPGDKIVVQDAQGSSTTFIVRKSQLYGQKDDAASVFISTDGKSHLNLVTCIGVWLTSAQSYSKRLVVFTDKVE